MFTPEEGRQGVLVTFLAMLELAKEQLLDFVQEAPLAPIYLKSLALNNTNEPLAFSSEFDDGDAANDN
jgi:segregation and condensation protein A